MIINEVKQESCEDEYIKVPKKALKYGTATSIGMALAKLELLEKQGCKVKESEE